MRILQLIQKKQLRGAEVFASQISSHMKLGGHEVMMVALVDGPAKLPFPGEIICLNANVSKKLFDIPAWKKLRNIIKEFNPDIVQANAADTLKYAIFSRMLYKWKAPVVFRNASVISRYLKSPVSKALTRFLVGRADHIASVSTVSAKDIRSLFPINEKKVTVIPIGIESVSLNKLSIFNNGMKNIVHVGGFTFEKNHEGILRIFSKCLARENGLMLWLVGEGPLRKKVETLVAEMGLREKVIFTGHVNNPLDHIFSGDVCILPSIIEGLPGVVAEAFYCRVPMIAYNVGGITDLIKDGINGWLVNPGDEAAFAERILDVVEMDSDNKQMVTDAAFKTVTEEFQNAELANRFLELYRSLQA